MNAMPKSLKSLGQFWGVLWLAGGTPASAVPIDLTHATPSVASATALRIEGIETLGSTYWATFEWNPSRNVFEVSDYAETPNEPPLVTIDAPRDGDQVDEADPLTLKGHATDPEDGDLSGQALAWDSDLEGYLGDGEVVRLPAYDLRPGLHILTLTATDRKGLSAETSVSIAVRGEPPTPGEGFVLLDPGVFMMGSPEDELGRSTDEPLHEVSLHHTFYLADTEVTQAQWERVMGDNPSHFPDCPDCPVEQVSWNDAVAYCNALSSLEGFTPAYVVGDTSVTWDSDANGYRLPTEAEWEYGCRAGMSTAFYSGTITEPNSCSSLDYHLDRIGWYCGNNGEEGEPGYGPKPGAQKKANAWGIYDSSGNVAEWCWDWYGIYDSDPVSDPTGPAFGKWRVRRGGSFATAGEGCRSADRWRFFPYQSNQYLGFRIAANGP